MVGEKNYHYYPLLGLLEYYGDPASSVKAYKRCTPIMQPTKASHIVFTRWQISSLPTHSSSMLLECFSSSSFLNNISKFSSQNLRTKIPFGVFWKSLTSASFIPEFSLQFFSLVNVKSLIWNFLMRLASFGSSIFPCWWFFDLHFNAVFVISNLVQKFFWLKLQLLQILNHLTCNRFSNLFYTRKHLTGF